MRFAAGKTRRMWRGTPECAIHDTGDGPSFAYGATMKSYVLSPTEKDAIVRKELKLVEVYLDNMRSTSAWHLHTVMGFARDSRSSLRKASALVGYTGQWWRDIWLYFATILPLFVPVNVLFGATIFTGLVAFVTGALSVVTMEPRVVEVPFLLIFKMTKTILVPVVHAPHWIISNGGASLIILAALLCSSVLLKSFWLREIDIRRRRIEHLWDAALSKTTA